MGLPNDWTYILKAEPGKDANLVFYLSVNKLLANMMKPLIFMSNQRHWRRHLIGARPPDMIKTHAMR